MRKNIPAAACLLCSVACLLAISGCSIPIPQAEKDPTRYYVLGATAANSPAAAASSGGPVIQLRAVELANYLSARPMIIRRGDNEIEFREFARWGESLDAGIGRVLREELLARGAARAVLVSGARREAAAPDYNLNVRVLACEGEAGGGVAFRAVWELAGAGATTPATAATTASGDFRAKDLRWDGKSEASLAAALSQAVAGLAGEIAVAIKK